MKSRERVLAAFAHEEPDRVPFWCGASTEFSDKAKRTLKLNDEELRVRLGDDFRRVFAFYNGPKPLFTHPEAVSRTIFGVERHGMGYGQPLHHPLAETDVKKVHDYAWPDPDWMDVSHIRAQAKAYNTEYAVLGGDWSPFWHDLIDLFGMENLYYKMYDAPAVVDAALQHIVDYYAEVSHRIFSAAGGSIDIFFIGNDLGSQTGPLLSCHLFERYLLPHLRRLINLGHDFKLKVQLHCCGGFEPLIPCMIESGLDGLHSIQPNCNGMDLATLKRNYGDKIVFNGGIDSHHVLILGTPESVRQQTLAVLQIMAPGGGYIAGASHDTILEETPVENVLAMSNAVREFTYGGKR